MLLAKILYIGNRNSAQSIHFNEVWIHKHSEGTIFSREINPKLTFSIARQKTFENWLSLYNPAIGDTIFDIGAGIGLETYFFSKMVGDIGKVIAIEAHPITFKCLSNLCLHNDLRNVIPLNYAIWDKKMKIQIDNPFHHFSSRVNFESKRITVDGKTIDDVVEELHISFIDFLKMNIEGAEINAIQGMKKAVRKIKYICISCHDFLFSGGRSDANKYKSVIE